MAARNRVDLIVNPASRKEEALIATTGMRPGELVLQNSAGKWARGAVAAAAGEKIFLLEDALQGKTMTDAYTADDLAQAVIALPGDVIYALLKDGQSVIPGDPLDAAGALGELQKATVATTKQIVAYSLDTAAPSGSAARIRVRIA